MADHPNLRRGNPVTVWQKGVSANPNGKISIKKTHAYACAHDPELAAAAGLTVEEARAKLYALEMKVALAGPRCPKDSNWTFAMGEMMNRHFGKPREHVEISQAEAPKVAWERVPAEEREEMLGSIRRLQAYVGEPETETEH